MFNRKVNAAAAVIAIGLMLAGCSGGTAPASESNKGGDDTTSEAMTNQSKSDACAIVQENLTEFSDLSSKLDPSDTQAMVDQFKQLSANTSEAFTSITNEDVAPAAKAAASGLNDYVVYLESVIADPSKASSISDEITALTESFTEVSTVCAS